MLFSDSYAIISFVHATVMWSGTDDLKLSNRPRTRTRRGEKSRLGGRNLDAVGRGPDGLGFRLKLLENINRITRGGGEMKTNPYVRRNNKSDGNTTVCCNHIVRRSIGKSFGMKRIFEHTCSAVRNDYSYPSMSSSYCVAVQLVLGV